MNNNMLTQQSQVLKTENLINEAIQLSHIRNKIEVKAINLTPNIAKELLKSNYQKQRNISESRVNAYAQDMLSGSWVLNGETFALDQNGMLLNGQHRCTAVVKSGITIPAIFVTGLSTESFKTIDQGFLRSMAQILTIDGHKSSALLASLARTIIYYNDSKQVTRSGPRCTVNMVSETVERYKDRMEQSANIAVKFNSRRKKTGFNTTVVAFSSFMLLENHRDEVLSFFNDLYDMNYRNIEGCPVRTFSQLIENFREKKYGFSQRVNMLSSCIIAYIKMESIKPTTKKWMFAKGLLKVD